MHNAVNEIIFLPMILSLGLITSYEDVRNSKIRNKWIMIGIFYSFSIYLLFYILHQFGLKGYHLFYNFDKWIINFLISSIMAYALWHYKIWSAGDAKLFIAYAALIPIGQYSKIYFNYYFASFFLLLTTFIPATVFFLLKSILYFYKRMNIRELKAKLLKLLKEGLQDLNKTEIFKVVFGFFVFFLFFRMLMNELFELFKSFSPNQNVLLLISLLAFRQLSKIFKRNFKFIIVAFFILLIYFFYKSVYQKELFIGELGFIFTRVATIMVLFPIFKLVMKLYVDRASKKDIPFAPILFLGALIVWFV